MSSIAIAVIGFFVWGHHMFPNGQSGPVNTIFSALTMLVAIPSAVKVWNWLATMYKGSIVLQTPMCYALGFFFLFAIGGLTGLFAGHPGHELPRPRHLLRRGPFPLRDVRRRAVHVHRRPALLVAEDHRPDVQRDRWASLCCLLEFVGLQPHVLPAVRHGHARHAAARYATYHARVPAVSRDVEHRGVPPDGVAFLLMWRRTCCTRSSAASGPRPTPGAARRWNGPAPRRRRTTTFPDPPHVGEPYDHEGLVWNETIGGYETR